MSNHHFNVSNLPESFYSLEYTESREGILCIAAMYPWHILTAYLATLSGFIALVTRLNKSWKQYHLWAGRCFIAFIILCQATAMLIMTTGLPRPISFFLSILTVFMIAGWFVIRFHAERFQTRLLATADTLLAAKGSQTMTATELMQEAKLSLMNRRRTWQERFFSLKALHGLCMGFAWWQMAGRTIISNPFANYSRCNTYPVYKPGTSKGEAFQPVPAYDPDYKLSGSMWFALYITIPAVLIILAIGVGFSVVAAHRQQAETENGAADDSLQSAEN